MSSNRNSVGNTEVVKCLTVAGSSGKRVRWDRVEKINCLLDFDVHHRLRRLPRRFAVGRHYRPLLQYVSDAADRGSVYLPVSCQTNSAAQ